MARGIWLRFVILLLSWLRCSCSQSCAGRCSCSTRGIPGQDTYEKIVNCSARALPSVPNTIPSDTTELNIKNNVISWLDTNVFRTLPKLQKVDLSNNNLQTLPHDVFNYNPSLREVHLNGNPLTCDCNLYGTYNISQHLAKFSGICSNPPSLANRELQSLKVYEFCGGCAGIKMTGKGSRDKEYFIQLKVKCEAFASVYCHGMNTNSPKEYISLRSGPVSNYALIYDYKQPESAKYECDQQTGGVLYSEAGITNFTKVRLILGPNSATVVSDDFQFATKVGKTVPLGVAGDCYSASPNNCRKGRFKIDLTGTGFHLKDGVHWEHYGTPSNINNTLEVDTDRSIVYGECGGYCGGCRPRGDIHLELDACPEEGVKPCSTSLGMDDRSIEDSQITALSNIANYLPSYGRLNNIKSASMGGSWCAGTSDVNQYLQIDMKKKMTFSGIATQGAGDAQNWLTKFKIMKSDDGNSFTDHTEFGIVKDFYANKDNYNVVTNWFSQRFRARYIRIMPLEWSNAICLRAELYGCDNDMVSVVVRKKSGDKRCWSPHGSEECNFADGTSMVLKSDCQGKGVMITFRKNNAIIHTCSGKCVTIDNNNLLTLRDGPCDTFRKQEKGVNEFIIIHEKSKLCIGLGNVKTGLLLLAACDLQPTLFEFSQDGISPLPPIITYADDNYLEVNKSGWVHCQVTADPRAQIFWSKTRPWPDGQSLSKLEFLQSLSGSLYVRKARMSYSGRYYCSAANTADFKFGSLNIKVGSPPNITLGPVDTKVVLNATVMLNCKVTNSNLPTKIFWYKRGPNRTAVSVDKLDLRFLVLTNMSLRIRLVQKNDEAHYLCVAKNPLGSNNSTAFLKVLIPPKFYVFPKDIEVPSSSSPIIHCKGIGDPAPVIKWFHKGSLNLPPNFKVYPNGSLFMSNIEKIDQGLYMCSASNEAGTVQVEAAVKVYVACRIDSIPYATYVPHRMFFHVDESTVVTCKTGYQMRQGPKFNITCVASGKFNKAIPKCKDIDECRVDPSTELNNHNVTKYHKCNKNALCVNTPGSYRCECSEGYKGNGTSCEPLCSRPKIPINARNWLPEQKYYDIGSSITLICKPGFKTESKSSVTCNSSHASFGHLPSCKDMDECVVGVQDINSGELHSACHHNAECSNSIGSYRCMCKSGFEGDGFNTCTVVKERLVKSSSGKEWKFSPKMDAVKDKLKEYKAKNTTAAAVLKVLEERTGVKQETLTSGDLIIIFETVKELLNDAKTPGTQTSKTEELKTVTKVCSNILAEDNKEHWEKIQKDSKGVTEVMKLMEDYTSALADDVVTLQASGNSSFLLDTDNIGLKLGVYQAKALYDGHKYPEGEQNPQVIIPGEVFHDYKSGLQSIKIVGITYKGLGNILPNRAEGVEKFDVDSSSVISTSLYPSPAMHDGKLPAPVKIALVKQKTTKQSAVPKCVFWDFKTDPDRGGSWSSEGCRVVVSSDNGTLCQCDHMTSFASLAVYDKELVFSLVVYIGCGILLLAVFILAIRHLCLYCKRKSERSVIHLHLYFAIAAAVGLFIGALKLTKIKAVCVLVAALLHYFFMAMFCWIIVKCLQIYMTLVTGKNKNRSRIKWFYIIGWLLPAVVVGASLGIFQLKGYGNSDWCWLDYKDRLLMWAFAGPAAAFFFVTLIFAILICVLKGRVLDSTDKSKISVALLLAVLLEIVIGGTWVAAAIYVKHHQARLWEYLFAGLCVLQGITLLVFGLLDKEIKNFSFLYQIKKIQQREHKEKRNYYSTTDTIQYYGAANAPDGKTYTVTRPSAKESIGDLRGSSKRLSRIGSNQEVNEPPDYPPLIVESPPELDDSYRRKIESQPIPYTPSYPNSEVIQLQTFPVRKASSETHSRFSSERQPDGAEAAELSPSNEHKDRYYSLPRSIGTSPAHSKLEQIPEKAPLLTDYQHSTTNATKSYQTPKVCTESCVTDSEKVPLTGDSSRRRSERAKARLEERYKMDKDSINRRKRKLRYSSGFLIGATIEEDRKPGEKDHASL